MPDTRTIRKGLYMAYKSTPDPDLQVILRFKVAGMYGGMDEGHRTYLMYLARTNWNDLSFEAKTIYRSLLSHMRAEEREDLAFAREKDRREDVRTAGWDHHDVAFDSGYHAGKQGLSVRILSGFFSDADRRTWKSVCLGYVMGRQRTQSPLKPGVIAVDMTDTYHASNHALRLLSNRR